MKWHIPPASSDAAFTNDANPSQCQSVAQVQPCRLALQTCQRNLPKVSCPLLLAVIFFLLGCGLSSDSLAQDQAANEQTQLDAQAPLADDAASEPEADVAAPPQQSEPENPGLTEDAGPAEAETAADRKLTESLPAEVSDREPGLRFSFSGASWREVLSWLAEEADLALHVGDVPSGSFTYFDPGTFTTDEAIARVNLFLIPQGYAAVRRDKLLSVIGLGDPRSLQQLDALATLTSVDELDSRSDHEVVKCIVPLGEIAADEATAELSPLMLMVAPVVLPRSNQMIVTETAAKVKSVLAVLQAMEIPEEDSVVRRFNLEHVDMETVLLVAASHLGLQPGETEGLDLSVSSDISGKKLFVTGSQEKVDRLESLIRTIDVPGETEQSLSGRTLRSHRVTGDNLQAVYDVLQTILAGKSLRLSMQPASNSIVALADAEVHQEIEQTIQELQAPAIDFAVIDIDTLDPYFVVSLISEMFADPADERRSRRRWRDDDDDEDSKAPKVDADPANRRLFVRGTTDQIDQIRKMVADLEPQQARRESVRVLPVPGHHGRQVLEAAERYWSGDNRVLILPSADDFETHGGVIERTVHPDQPQDQPVSAPAAPRTIPEDPFEAGAAPRRGEATTADALVSLLDGQDAQQPVHTRTSKIGRPAVSPIRSQIVPQGIMIQSDDLAALDQFENHLREIAATNSRSPSPPVVYYLKYVSAEDAVKMLADLLDGGQSLAQTPPGTLINASNSQFSSASLGSFTFNRDGMTTVTSGTATIVSDARLNRLIIQGTTEDVDVIDGYLKIIDKGTSMTNIETWGRSHVIELQHTKAADVAETIKQAYPNRIATNAQAGGQQGRSDRDRRGDDDRRRDDDDRRRDVDDKPTRGREPELAVAVHESSNSLVITAPDSLFAEVEQLVRVVDSRSEQVTEVIPAAAGVDLEMILSTLNGEASTSDRGSQRGRSDRNDSRDRRRGR